MEYESQNPSEFLEHLAEVVEESDPQFQTEGRTDTERAFRKILRQYPPLSRAAEESLTKKVHQSKDQEAIKTLVLHHIRQVYGIARRSAYRADLYDLITAGVCGLLRAISTFTPGKNARLSTYARFFIKDEVRAEVNRCSAIPLPRHVMDNAEKLNRIQQHYECEFGVKPSAQLLSELSKLSKSQIITAQILPSTVSLHAVESQTRQVEDKPFLTTEDREFSIDFNREEVQQALRNAIYSLTPTERRWLELYGSGNKAKEISELMGRSKGRISQLQKKTLDKLRAALPKEFRTMLPQ